MAEQVSPMHRKAQKARMTIRTWVVITVGWRVVIEAEIAIGTQTSAFLLL